MTLRTLLKTCASIFLFAGLSGPAHAAGGIDSGGGELLRDQNNPWFVSNTKTVRYCLDIDEANFGLSRVKADEEFRAALSYWKREFAIGRNSELAVSTQNFVQESCPEAGAGVDLRVQLGQLTPAQAKRIGNPKDFVATTIRATYDPVTLKGGGFIYVAPEKGPARLMDAGVAPALWSRMDGRTLRMIFAHELGHVFGLRHSASGDLSLMRDDFPDELAHSNEAKVASAMRRILDPGFFRFVSADDANCFARDVSKPFFGIKDDYDCLRVVLDREGFQVFTANDRVPGAPIPWKLVGSGKLTATSQVIDLATSMQLFLTPAQRVYSYGSGIVHRSPYIETATVSGTYENLVRTVKRQVLVQLRPRSFGLRFDIVMSGELDARLIPDVLHR